MTTDVNVNIEEYRQLIVVIQQTQTSIANLQAQQKDCDKALQESKGMKEVVSQGEKAEGIIKIVGLALRTVASMGDGFVNKLAEIAGTSYELGKGFADAAAGAGLLESSIATSWVTFGLTAILTVISAISEAEERAKQRAEEFRREISEIRNNNIGASELISEYEALSNKTIKTAEDTERMRDIRAELVEQYGYSADVGRILRTFKIKKNVEVTDNGKDNF